MGTKAFTLGVATAAALAGSACGSERAKECTPGGDGAYVSEPYETLSSYCMVTIEAGRVVPKRGVVPYDVIDALFSDYALKERTIWLPQGKKITRAGDALTFPTGTIVTKSFGYSPDITSPAGAKWLETRLLVRAEAGWRAYTYVWDDAQREASIRPGGAFIDVAFAHPSGPKKTSYFVPNQNQCKKCHADGEAIAAIGLRVDQLDRDFDYGDGRENQIARWTRLGLFEGAPPAPPRLARWDDPTLPIETRARAYLDANCAYCHNETGEAKTSGLMLGVKVTDPYALGVCKTPVAAGKAAANMKYAIVPGRPDESILVHRMLATEPAIAMPEIGRSLVHEEAVAVVRQWITGLPGGCAP
jgi:uncharacterized repeat protein (TIGR03806 family)